MMQQRGKTAVVCGASVGGLLAARVLADSCEAVTIVERDVLPETVAQRRGVSQGRHLHALQRLGSCVLDELLPGLSAELLAAGANVMDGRDPAELRADIGGHLLCRSGTFADPDSLVIQIPSRPLLEAHVRRRVRDMSRVTFVENHDVVEPVLGSPGRVTGVRVVDRATSRERLLEADIVVDATGRSARTPAFLEAHDYPAPPEKKYAVGLSYSSQLFRVSEGALAEKMVVAAPTAKRLTGAGLLAYENNTVILTLIGIADQPLPTDLPGVMTLAADLLPDAIVTELNSAEPIGDVTAQHYPTSVWRRYDKVTRFPKGFAVLGDAVCSFNPVYGQGMSSSAIQAKALRDSLADTDIDDLSRVYFKRSSRKLAPIWNANRFNDFAVIPARDWRALPQRFLNWYRDKLMVAASNDLVVTEALLRTIGLVDPFTHLLRPSLVLRVVRENSRSASGVRAGADGLG